MRQLVHTAAFAALLTLVAAFRLDAQAGSIRVTLSGGRHAGSYQFPAAQCDVFGGRGKRVSISLMTPERQAGSTDPASMPGVDLAIEEGTDGPNGLAIDVEFRGSGKARDRTVYRIYDVPPELQGGATEPREGRGEVTIRRTDAGIVSSFKGETKDGVRLEGTLECGI
jgi:hypothetical protein